MLISLNADAYAKTTKPASKEKPTKIRSDIIDIKRNSQTVNFIGNVIIEKDDSSLLSEKMIVLYDEKKEKKPLPKKTAVEVENSDNFAESETDQNTETSEQSSIRKIYTDEKVKIFSDEFVAVGDSGYYDPKEDVFVLEKNVMVNNGVSIAKGDKFIHHLSTKKSYFAGEKDSEKDDATKQDDGVDRRVVVIIGNDAKEFKNTRNKEQND